MPLILNLKKVGDGGRVWVRVTECPFVPPWRMEEEKREEWSPQPSHNLGSNTTLSGRNALSHRL